MGATLLVVDARRLLDAWLSVAALSFEAAAADPIVLDPRIHSSAHRPGQAAVAARMRILLSLWSAATARLDPDLGDRPLRPDVEAARQLIADWEIELG